MLSGAGLIKICRSDLRRIRPLHHAASILAGDASTITCIDRDRHASRRNIGEIGFWLETRAALEPAAERIQVVLHFKPEIVKAQAGVQVQALSRKSHSLLEVAGNIGYVSMGAGGRCQNLALPGMQKSYIDLIIVEIGAQSKQGGAS